MLNRPLDLLRRGKYVTSSRLSAKVYWSLMGRLRPVPAVTSEYGTVEDCLASGAAIVSLLDRLDVIRPESVTLHIGSGLGRVEYHLRRRVSKCYGVDISSSMVRRARGLVPFDNVEFVESEGIDLSRWPDGTFQLIYSFLVFQHLPRPQFSRYLAEAHAKLMGGGHLVFQALVDDTGTMPEPPASHPYGLRYYARDEIEAQLHATGFRGVGRSDLRGEPDIETTLTGDVVFRATK